MAKNTFELLRDALAEELLNTVDMMDEEPPFGAKKLDSEEQLLRYEKYREDTSFWDKLLDTNGWAQTIRDAKELESEYKRREENAPSTSRLAKPLAEPYPGRVASEQPGEVGSGERGDSTPDQTTNY